MCDARAGPSYRMSGGGFRGGHFIPPTSRTHSLMSRNSDARTFRTAHDQPSLATFCNFRPPPAQLFTTSSLSTNDVTGLVEGKDQGEQGEDQAEQAAALASGERGGGGANVMACHVVHTYAASSTTKHCYDARCV